MIRAISVREDDSMRNTGAEATIARALLHIALPQVERDPGIILRAVTLAGCGGCPPKEG